MGIFHEMRESEGETVIVYTYFPLFYIAFAAALAGVFLLHPSYAPHITAAFALFIALFIVDFWRPLRETRQAVKSGRCKELSGSKFSFKNPLRVVIDKEAGEK